MEESTGTSLLQNKNNNLNDLNIVAELNNSQETSPYIMKLMEDYSDDEEAPITRVRKRIQKFSDSDTEKDTIGCPDNKNGESDSESEARHIPLKSGVNKSRIQICGSSSDSDERQETVKNEEQQIRMKNKRNKLQQKFKGLLSSRFKSNSQNPSDKSSEDDKSEDSGPGDFENEMCSVNKIKEIIKSGMAKIPSVCDPDTSDDEDSVKKHAPKQKQKKEQKSTKMIEAKPIRMSAKQAMENMHLIKSESNRMLREKAVSLPYHRPKALSLKDIMARRKPAVTSDGRALPIKMNEEQLKQYALQLEQRQKEMMELCKSESDEDTAAPELDTKEEVPLPNESENNEHKIEINIQESNSEQKENNSINMNIESDVNTNIENSNKISSIDEDVPQTDSNKEANESVNSETNENDSNTDIRLVYHNSIHEDNVALNNSENIHKEHEIIDDRIASHTTNSLEKTKGYSEQESQLISLHYTENTDETSEINRLDNTSHDKVAELINKSEEFAKLNKNSDEIIEINVNSQEVTKLNDNSDKLNENSEQMDIVEDEQNDFFSDDDDVNMEDIDKIIENAEIMKNDEDVNSPMLNKDTFKTNPKIMGAPGMVIDLDGTDPVMPKRSGVELLKERFNYFSKLKTPEELEREREKKLKPGAQHLKLKQELEEKIAEQRSLEWAKRLEEEKQQHQEMESILDDADEADDSIEKIEAKLDDEKNDASSESEEEEELIENDVEIKDNPRKHNPMLDDEAEESDIEDNDANTEVNDDIVEGEENDEGDNEESSEEESSESEEEETTKPKKGRILKAFEDSDDESGTNKEDEIENLVKDNTEQNENVEKSNETDSVEPTPNSCGIPNSSQDDVIQLAQRHQSVSEDLFTSQENLTPKDSNNKETSDEVLGTQTFSLSSVKPADFLYPSQPYHDPNLNAITDGFTQNVLSSQLPSQASQSQPIGEDILALCTGKFYDNEFVSQIDDKVTETISQDAYLEDNLEDKDIETTGNRDRVKSSRIDAFVSASEIKIPDENITVETKMTKEDGHLKSILDELDDPEFDKPKQNKFFTGATQNKNTAESYQMKKRLIIDSDDENNETNTASEGKRKKLKKKKLEQRALQISDDEDEEEEELDEDVSELSDMEENEERLVEYDSEENEIEIKADKPKKKRKATDFFENEAELTSEDEWVGSGDEDEHGLDKMEREEGDDEVFHQGKLQKELGQIHMRDVMDQDKREVRMLQELLFEDGDLGDGHRQRKFRWRNTEDEEAGTVPDELADTQEEEFESEEQWRKQRHEREVFLRQMQNQGEEENLDVTVNRNAIIKANLNSKSMSALLMEVNQTKMETADSPVPEKKTVKDIPSPKKSFSIFQQNYHSSLLTRGRGALARLAALATPLAVDDDAPKISSLASHKRNFVFTALTPDEGQPKVTIKRKADAGTPKLVKKMRIEEKQSHPKSSLLDHMNL